MAKKSSLKRRIISLGLAMVVMVAASVGAVWMALAALSGQVSSQFNVSYTAKNVIADVLCEYQQTGQELTTLGSASFDGTEKEENGNNVINFNSKDFVLNKATDTVEIYYTILNKATTYGFGVSLQVGGITDPNMSVKYSLEYNNGATRPATNFNLTEVPTDMYLTESGTDTSCLLFAIQIGVLDPEKNATAENITMDFVLDSTAPQPAPKWTYGNVDIWNADSKTFNTNIFNKLLQSITGDASTSLSNMAKIEELANTEDNNHVSGATPSYINAFQSSIKGNPISLTLGGLTWTPFFLSPTSYDGYILTLVACRNMYNKSTTETRSQQDAYTNRAADEGEYYGFYDGRLYSTFSAGYKSTSWNVQYPSAQYGTSYLRAVTLNNGGSYAISETELATAEQNPNSVFAPFTMEEFGLTKYITQPKNVYWQLTPGYASYYNNDIIMAKDKEFCDDEYYIAWQNDFLWPTTGFDYEIMMKTYSSGIGFFRGLTWWTRTTASSVPKPTIGTAQLIASSGGFGSRSTSASNALVRSCWNVSGTTWANQGMDPSKPFLVCPPAMHLNLTKIAQDFGK